MQEGIQTDRPDSMESPPLKWKNLPAQMAVGIGLFVTVMVILGRAYHDEFLHLSRAFVDTLGGFGVALGFFLTDAFPIPLPPDPVMVFASLGGMNFGTIVLWAGSGSILGGTAGFLIGRMIAKTRLFERITAGKRAGAYDLVRRYGTLGLAVCTLTPLPYCVASWACGALKMPYPRFLAVSLLRFARVSLYMTFIHFGLLKLL